MVSILDRAKKIVEERQEDYAPPAQNFQDIKSGWEIIFRKGVTIHTIPLAMVWLKICRELNNPKQDNRDDIVGYMVCDDEIYKQELTNKYE